LKEVQSLFIADIHRAIESLRRSLAMGPSSAHQSALYARDLADALHGIDLPRHAELALVISAQFSQGRPGIEQPAAELIRLTALLVEDLLDGRPIESDDGALKGLAQAVSAFEDQPIDLDSPAFALSPDLSRPAFQALQESQRPEPMLLAESDPFRAPMTHGDSRPAEIAVSTSHAVAEFEQGLRGLKVLESELTNALNPERARQVRHRITDQSNWLLSLGQRPIADFLATLSCEIAGAEEVRVDQEIGNALFSCLAQMPGLQSVRVGNQQLTVFIEIEGVEGSYFQSQAQHALHGLAREFSARVDPTARGFRLVIPSSLRRMRVVPFMRSGKLYALSWAQFLGAAALGQSGLTHEDQLGQVNEARLEIQGKSGQTPFVLYAHEVRPFEFANCARLPEGAKAEPWVAGLALGSEAQPMVWLVAA
jgi:hypothetical protein